MIELPTLNAAESPAKSAAEILRQSLVAIASRHLDGTTFDRSGATKCAEAELGVLPATACRHFKKFCADTGVEFPKAARYRKYDREAVDTAFSTWHAAGYTLQEIEAGLVQYFHYPATSVAQAAHKIGVELGLITARAGRRRQQAAQWFADPKNTQNEPKKQIVAAFAAHHQVTLSVAQSHYNRWRWALDYQHAVTKLTLEQPLTDAKNKWGAPQ